MYILIENKSHNYYIPAFKTNLIKTKLNGNKVVVFSLVVFKNLNSIYDINFQLENEFQFWSVLIICIYDKTFVENNKCEKKKINCFVIALIMPNGFLMLFGSR